MTSSSRRCAGIVAERPSVIQVALDQAWISVGDRPER